MKKGLTWGIVLVVVLILSGVGYHFWQQSKMAESTDDAYVEGDVATISAEVAGRIVDVNVKDNQPVKRATSWCASRATTTNPNWPRRNATCVRPRRKLWRPGPNGS